MIEDLVVFGLETDDTHSQGFGAHGAVGSHEWSTPKRGSQTPRAGKCMNDTPPPSPGAPQRHWSQGLRPLWWWLLLVLVLFGIRTHQRLSEETRLDFSLSLQNRSVLREASAGLDGQPVASGERVRIGWHT